MPALNWKQKSAKSNFTAECQKRYRAEIKMKTAHNNSLAIQLVQLPHQTAKRMSKSDTDMNENILQSVYLETTIPSFAAARHSRDLIIAGHQAATMQFWENERHKYRLYISQYVIDECVDGDKEAAQRRFAFVKDIKVIPISDKIKALSEIYQKLLDIPERAKLDCFHLSVCVEAKMDYLLTWNCKHLGIQIFSKINEYNSKNNLWTPLLVTPDDFIEAEELE
jgi:predicted nucleic acid-binding protein